MAIFTAIGTAIAGSAALFGGLITAGQLVGAGLAFAANIGMQYLRRPKARKYSAIQGETRYGGDVPVGTLYGTGPTKGHRIFYAKYDRGNKFNAEVFVLANGWCDGLEPYVYVYGEKRALIPTTFPESNQTAAYFVEGFTNHVRILFFDGRPGQAVDQHLVNVTAGLGQTWKSTSVCTGQAYVVVYREYNADLFSQGKPEFQFVLRGLKEYDPRKDSTVAGGSGPQRIDDPSTWVHTNNPAVHRLNYQLGLKGMVSGRTLVGEGKSIGQLDLGTYFVAMNVCDSLRSDGKKRYECSLWVNGDDDHTEVLKEFDDAMAGYGLNRRGLSGVIAGAPQIPVMEITADDIPADRAKDIQFRKSAFERYNHLSGQFTSIEAMWQPESLTPIYVNADVAEDGGRIRQTSNDFLQVSDPDLAQYLLTIRYRQNRKGGTATLPVSRRAGLQVQEGEWIEWRGREWMISEWICDEQFRITLKLTETGADIYDDEEIEPGPVIIPPTPPVNPSMLFTVQNFGVEAGIITSAAGFDVPALKFTWDPPNDPTITAVRFQYRPNDDGTELFDDQCADPQSGAYTTTKNVVSDEFYVARAIITTVPDRLRNYTPWTPTASKTGTLVSQADVLDGSITAQKIADAAITAAKIQNEAVTNLKLADQAVSTAKLAVAAVTAAIIANGAVIEAKLGDAAVSARALADQAVTATKFASSIKPVEVLSALPGAPHVEGRQVYLTTDKKLYRNTGTGWIATVAADDISGQLTDAKIAAVAASKVTGQMTDAQIAAVSAAKVSGQLVSSQIADLAITNGKLAALAVDAAKLADGAVIAAKIADSAVTTAKFAAGIQPVSIVAGTTVPTTKTTDVITVNGKLYRWSGSAYTAAVPAADLTGQVVSTQIADLAVTNAKLAALAVDAAKLANNAVTETKISDNAITTPKVAANAIVAEHIAARAVTASKLLISDFSNLVPDESFEGENWTLPSGWSYGAVSIGAGLKGLIYTQPSGSPSGYIGANGPLFPVKAGSQYRISYKCFSTGAYTIWGRIDTYDASGVTTVAPISSMAVAAGAGEQTIAANFNMPATAVTARFYFYVQRTGLATGQTVHVTSPTLNLRNAGELIVDGAIVADHLSANSVTTAKIATGAVTANELAANSVTAGKIQAGAVSADQIAANAITTAKIATGAVTANELAANSVVAGKVAANAIVAENIAARAITASKLALTQSSTGPNLVLDRYYQDPGYWDPNANVTLVSSADSAVAAMGVPGAMKFNVLVGRQEGMTRMHGWIKNPIPLAPNTWYRARVRAKNVGCNKSLNLGMNSVVVSEGTPGGGGISSSASAFTSAAGSTWEWSFKTASGSSSSAQLVPYVDPGADGTGYWLLTDYELVPMAEASLIVDGSIYARHIVANEVTTEKIATGAVTANEIAANAITAVKLAAGSVETAKLAAGAVSTDKLAANAVTAAKIDALAVTSDKLAANSVIAGKIAVGAVSADQIASNAITAAKIAAGAVSADKLAVGTGANWFTNADFSAGLTGWGIRDNAGSGSISIRTDAYGISPYGSLQVYYPGSATNLYVDAWQTDASGAGVRWPCEAGKSYEISGKFFGHRLNLQIFIQYLDADGVHLAYAGGNSFTSMSGLPNSDLANYLPFFVKTTPPAGAVSMRPFFRCGVISGQTSAYLWLKNVYLGEATANQTEASRFSNGGVTLIQEGNIVTNAITADKISANAVTTAKIATGAVTANEIAAGAITAVKIAASSITGDKIAANTIGAANIAADSITARQLVLTDYENLVPNGYFSEAQSPSEYWDSSGTNSSSYPVNLTGYNNGNTTGSQVGFFQKSGAVSAFITLKNPYLIPVTGGEKLYAETACASNSGTSSVGFYFRLMWLDVNKNDLGTYTDIAGNAAIPSQTTYTVYKGQATVPSNARFCRVRIFNHSTSTLGNLFIDRVIVRRAKGADLIVDGSITADKIAANSITADKLNVTSLSAISANLGSVNISDAIIGNLKVGTSNIVAGAVSDNKFYADLSEQSIPAGTEAIVAQVTVTVPFEGQVLLNFSASLSLQTAVNAQAALYQLKIYRGSTLLWTFGTAHTTTGVNWIAGGAAIGGEVKQPFPDLTPPAGTHNYSIVYYAQSGFAVTPKLANRILTATVYKR